jgi:hypothetical protein
MKAAGFRHHHPVERNIEDGEGRSHHRRHHAIASGQIKDSIPHPTPGLDQLARSRDTTKAPRKQQLVLPRRCSYRLSPQLRPGPLLPTDPRLSSPP